MLTIIEDLWLSTGAIEKRSLVLVGAGLAPLLAS